MVRAFAHGVMDSSDRSFVVDRPLKVRWRIVSILHGGPFELIHVPASAPRLVYLLSCLWHGAYKITLLLIGKSSPGGGSGCPLSLSELSFTICPTPYNRGAMDRRIDPSWGGPIELFLVPASVTKAVVCVILSVGWCI